MGAPQQPPQQSRSTMDQADMSAAQQSGQEQTSADATTQAQGGTQEQPEQSRQESDHPEQSAQAPMASPQVRPLGSYDTVPPATAPSTPPHTAPLWDRLNERYSPLATQSSDPEDGYWHVQYGPQALSASPPPRPAPRQHFPGFQREYTHLSDPDLRARFEEWHAANNEEVERSLREGVVNQVDRLTSESPLSASPEPAPMTIPARTHATASEVPAAAAAGALPGSFPDREAVIPSFSPRTRGFSPTTPHADRALWVENLQAENRRLMAENSRLRSENMLLNRQNLVLTNTAANRRVDNMILQEEATVLARGLRETMQVLQVSEAELLEAARQHEGRQNEEEMEEGEIREGDEAEQ